MSGLDDPLDPPDDDDSEPVAVRLASMILADAVKRGAESVHVQPVGERWNIRFRIEGGLLLARQIPEALGRIVVTRFKLLALLDIAERRLPQDGRLTVRMENSEATFAVSTMPTDLGESLILHRLDGPMARLDRLSDLGYPAATLEALQRALRRPGLILFAGPTFSGRHTSLYAALGWLNLPDVVIATAEDPVRYTLPGVRQTQVVEEIGLGFAAVLRALLRQDVDVIGLGDIRDFETAEVSAMTVQRGKRVVGTIHTRSAALTFERLRNMGLDSWLVADSLTLVVAQRLLRKLCARCRVAEATDPAALAALGVPAARAATATLFRAAGCADCNETGYSGRLLVAETVETSAEVRAALRRNELSAPAVTLRALALEHACTGITSVEEALLVTPD